MRGLHTYVANDSTRFHTWACVWHPTWTLLGRPADQFGQLDARWTIPDKNKYVEEMICSYLGPVYMKVGDPR